MNAGTVLCLTLAAVFGIIGLVFAVTKEKGAMLVSGFNTLSREERDKYDKARLSRDMRNQLFLWAAILAAGGLLSHLITGYAAIPALVLWVILFSRDVHWDVHKAFDKYLLTDTASETGPDDTSRIQD